MIRRLQIKIVVVIMGILLLVFAAVFFVLNLSLHRASEIRTDGVMIFIIENDGFELPSLDSSIIPSLDSSIIPSLDPSIFMPGMNRRRPFTNTEMIHGGRFFYVKIDHSGNVFEENTIMMFGIETDDRQEYIKSALNSGRQKGDIESLRFRIAEKPYGQMIVFIERTIDDFFIERLNWISIWAAGIVCIVLLCLTLFLAKWIVAPVKNSFERQRRFISDASHELKTPLTIIGANVDVLQNEISENQRLAHIKLQSERMNGLVHDLLILARADEGQMGIIRNKMDLSGEILNTALEFESRAYEEGKQYSYNIEENIIYAGDEKQIKQLMNILIDNAIRHSDAHGQIEVSLRAESGHIRISVFNTGVGVSSNEQKIIFERFYRTDESRSRETGGYGIGLSIAKAIVDSHKGKITVSGEYMKWIRFDVVLMQY